MTLKQARSTIFSTTDYSSTDHSIFGQPNREIGGYSFFKIHPLVAIEHFIAERAAGDPDSYPRYELFQNQHFFNEAEGYVNNYLCRIKDFEIPNYEEFRDCVLEAVDYYRTEITMCTLQGQKLSDWLTKLSTAIVDMDQKKLHSDHLLIVNKLVPFYNFDTQVANMAKNCESVKLGMQNDPIKLKNLELLGTLKPQTRNQKGAVAHFFKTEQGHLLRADMWNALPSAVETILKMNNSIDLTINYYCRTIYSENFNYIVANNIHSVSV